MQGKSRSNHGISLRVRKLRFRWDKHTRRHNLTFQPKLLCLMSSSLHLLRSSVCIFFPFYFVCLLNPINEPNHKFKHLDSQRTPSHHISPREETHLKGCFLQIHPQSPSTPSGSEQHEIFPIHISPSFHFLIFLRESVLVCVTTNVRLVFVSSTLSEFLSIRYILLINIYSCCIQMVKCFSFLASLCQDFLGLLSWL